jgi:ADP-dependent NAD(P)H-hydrate dehydratase
MTDLPVLFPRRPETHKGDYGRALLVGGSRGMTGAVALAGMAALRGGSGLVRLAVPESCVATVAALEPSYMTSPLPEDRRGRIALDARLSIVRLAAEATVVACGPGMGRSFGLDALVARLYRELSGPMVVDADALNALAVRRDALAQPGGPRILTPHPGEFARLLGRTRVPREEQENLACELAFQSGAIVVLKGHRTLVTDGRRLAVNATGNPGMATGGSGDVLTGLVTALACQCQGLGQGPWDAARLGVYLHGLAGDLAAAEVGHESLIASDLIRFLPAAFAEYWRTVGTGLGV